MKRWLFREPPAGSPPRGLARELSISPLLLDILWRRGLDSPEELAAMFSAQRGLDYKGGMLVTNPIPEEYSMDKAVIDKAIDEALAQAKAQGIHGKETTPFLLAKVVELTGGDSLESNIQLVLNNARLAAKTAAALA